MKTRRELLKTSATIATLLMGAGLLPATAQAAYNSAAFETKSMDDLMKEQSASAPAESADITLKGPDISEIGAVVPVGASTTLPGVKRMLLLVEKNPNILSAMFEFTDAVEPSVGTRVKMGQSSNVFAVAMMNDGRVLYAQKEIKV